MAEPLAVQAKNPGHTDRFTCPGCYQDFPPGTSEGVHECRICDRQVRLVVETQQVAAAYLIDEEDKHD